MPVNLTALLDLASRPGMDLFEQIMDRMTPEECMRALAAYGHVGHSHEFPENLTAESLLSYLNYHDGKGSFYDTSGWETLAPKLLSGLTSYVDFKDAENLFTTSSGSTNPAATNDPVGKALDLSGNSRHPVQTTDANRPTWNANGYLQVPGGLPSVVGLVYPGNASSYFSTTNNTFMVLGRWNGSPLTQMWGNASGFEIVTVAAGPVVRGGMWNGTANQSNVDGPAIAGDTDYIFTVRRSDKVYVSKNGGTASAGVAVTGNLTGLGFPLGIPSSGSANVANCRIYAAVTYNRELAVYERNFLGRWFGYRFGIDWVHQTA